MRSRARRGRSPLLPILRGPLGALLASLVLCSCVTHVRAPGVALSTEPPGASVLVDGRESGFVTPCHLALDKDDSHTLRFELPGYEPVERSLWPHLRTEGAHWDDADGWPRRFPGWTLLTFRDFWTPYQKDNSLSPRRMHVKLHLEGDDG